MIVIKDLNNSHNDDIIPAKMLVIDSKNEDRQDKVLKDNKYSARLGRVPDNIGHIFHNL